MNSDIIWKYDILLSYNEHFIVNKLNILHLMKQNYLINNFTQYKQAHFS